MHKIGWNIHPRKPYRFINLNPLVLLFLTLLLVPVVAGLFWCTISVATWFYHTATLTYEAAQNKSLKSRVQHLNHKYKRISDNLGSIYTEEENLRISLGLPHPENTTKISAKKINTPEDAFLVFLNPATQKLKDLRYLLDATQYSLQNSQNHLKAMTSYLIQKTVNWRRMPYAKPAEGNLTSGFGYRVHPISGTVALHQGLDIANSTWTPIHASADGKVTHAEYHENYGNWVVISHGNGFESKYAHLVKSNVKQGQKIKRNDLIGFMGATGRTTGVHLHYEIHRDHTARNPIQYMLPQGLIVD